jgi:hypothetical protein
MDAIRQNLDDHESRILSVFAFGNNSIVDDFLDLIAGASAVHPDVWDRAGTGTGTYGVVSQHQCKLLTAAAADSASIAAADGKVRFNLTEDYTAVFECRVYKAGGTDDNFFFGLQDASLGMVAATVADNSDRIGFHRDPAAAAWSFETANTGGGGGAGTGVAGIGTSTAWGIYRITLTCSGTAGNRQAKVEAGTTLANMTEISGSPFTNAGGDLPDTVYLRPYFGVQRVGATNLDLRIDYCLAYTIGRPLAA